MSSFLLLRSGAGWLRTFTADVVRLMVSLLVRHGLRVSYPSINASKNVCAAGVVARARWFVSRGSHRGSSEQRGELPLARHRLAGRALAGAGGRVAEFVAPAGECTPQAAGALAILAGLLIPAVGSVHFVRVVHAPPPSQTSLVQLWRSSGQATPAALSWRRASWQRRISPPGRVRLVARRP